MINLINLTDLVFQDFSFRNISTYKTEYFYHMVGIRCVRLNLLTKIVLKNFLIIDLHLRKFLIFKCKLKNEFLENTMFDTLQETSNLTFSNFWINQIYIEETFSKPSENTLNILFLDFINVYNVDRLNINDFVVENSLACTIYSNISKKFLDGILISKDVKNLFLKNTLFRNISYQSN